MIPIEFQTKSNVREEAVKTLVNELGMKESDAENELTMYLKKKEEERKRERKRTIFEMVEEAEEEVKE